MAKKAPSIKFNRETFQFEGLTAEIEASLRAEFPGKNVGGELARMALWLQTPKGMTRMGNLAFIRRWLANASDYINAPHNYSSTTEVLDGTVLHLIDNYLEGLWINNEHLLRLNCIAT